MKKNVRLLLILIAVIGQISVMGQYKKADIFKISNDVTWLGVDYSELKFIGPASGWGEVALKTPTEMRDRFFPAWNELIVKEEKAFRLADAIGRLEVNKAIEITADANAKMNKKEIFSENIGDFQSLNENDVYSMVKKYDFKGKTGIGFLLIAEGMSKGRAEASYWVTFVDMQSKTVLLTKRMLGEAGGVGFRNYWANTVKSVMKSLKKDFKSWE